MEKIRNKEGRIISYREKVYVDGKAVSRTFSKKTDAVNWKYSFSTEVKKKKALGIAHIKSIGLKSFSEKWLKIKDNQGLARRSLDTYRASLRNYLIPVLKNTKLENINLNHVQRIIELCKANNLQAVRINTNLQVLGQMLNDAITHNHLDCNPIKRMKKVKVPPRSISYWSPEQVDTFLSKNEDDPLFLVYALALNTGMRRGELLGLCWDKVNLQDWRIEISRIRDRYGLKNTTKTGIIRHLPLNDIAWGILNELSENKNHREFVFAYEDGSLPSVPHISDRYFKRAVKRAEVPLIRFHDLRTTYASNFVMAGGDVFVLSKLLGHTSVEMTTKKYAAFHPNFMQDVAKTIQFKIRKKEERKRGIHV